MHTQHLRISGAGVCGCGCGVGEVADSAWEVFVTTTSESSGEGDCRLREDKARGDVGGSDGEERLREAGDGAEAIVSRFRSKACDGCYCIVGVQL
jgi:hypothetical protein